MGWGTDFNADIYLSRELYRSKDEIEDKIKESEKLINDFKSDIKMYIGGDAKSFKDDDESLTCWINNTVNDIFEYIETENVLNYQRRLLIENFNNKTDNI